MAAKRAAELAAAAEKLTMDQFNAERGEASRLADAAIATQTRLAGGAYTWYTSP